MNFNILQTLQPQCASWSGKFCRAAADLAGKADLAGAGSCGMWAKPPAGRSESGEQVQTGPILNGRFRDHRRSRGLCSRSCGAILAGRLLSVPGIFILFPEKLLRGRFPSAPLGGVLKGRRIGINATAGKLAMEVIPTLADASAYRVRIGGKEAFELIADELQADPQLAAPGEIQL